MSEENKKGFLMGFDSNTIDHLGIKLYSTFPPVIAELISNSYDAEAHNVTVMIDYEEKTIKVTDDGTGMSHEEINEAYLKIGRNRRTKVNSGLSKNRLRKVTGKKGLGKLAIFGVANSITINSVCDGFFNSLRINYNDLKSQQPPYHPEPLAEYQEIKEKNQTCIIIEEIEQSITSVDVLALGLARRFNFFDDDFKVNITDNNGVDVKVTKELYTNLFEKQYEWTFPESFGEEISKNAYLKLLNDQKVTGKISTTFTPLKKINQGFNVFARGKIASENEFFNDRSNDQFNQYVFGYFTVDIIDEDDEKDFIGTARQSILWERSEISQEIKLALDELIKLIGNFWRKKRATDKNDRMEEIIPESFFENLSPADKQQLTKIKNTLIANSIETTDAEPVLKILETVKDLYKFQSFQEYVFDLTDSDITVENIKKIAEDWELIEAKEMAKIALGRVSAIEQFERFIREDASENKVIQPFLEKFPWILNPRITTFEREVTFKRILKENFPDEKFLEESNRRLDFLCYLTNGELIIIELKRPRIKISDKEINQALEYQDYLRKHHRDVIERGVKTYLVSDSFELNPIAKRLYPSLEKSGELTILSYSDLLVQAKQYNKEFIDLYEQLQDTVIKKESEV
ncbi:ATP-binding protein [Lactococcus lactis]|uniref:ATP-binding protein n=1 Tax=Lactococcus lactis TaxID=1358 RepID=UPI001CF5C352|nr:ATP-binding protein [Lactococcus lactis]UCS89656.1 ATP-binding protein [Lactococcus lactis]